MLFAVLSKAGRGVWVASRVCVPPSQLWDGSLKEDPHSFQELVVCHIQTIQNQQFIFGK